MNSADPDPNAPSAAELALRQEVAQLREQVRGLQAYVSEHQAVTEALQRSEERYKSVIEHVGEGMIVIQNEKVAYVNNRAAEIARIPREIMLTLGFLHSIHPDDQKLVLDRQRRRLAGEVVPDRYELRLLHEDASITWIEVGVTLVPWEGKPAALTFFSNINHRKGLEEQLRSTLGEREAILNSALVGITYNVNRHIEWINDKYIEMTGFTRADLLGQSSRIFYESDEAYQRDGELTHAALARDGSYTSERQIKRRNGESFWVVLSGRCVVDRNPDAGVIWTMLDITDRRQAEEDIRAALQRQTELNELRSRFVAMTSHEFRTPLATILSSSELLRYYNNRMSEDDRVETLASIETAVHRMTRMLERVLLIGKTEAQMLEFRPAPLNLDELCRTLVSDAQSQAEAGAPGIHYQFRASQPEGAFDDKLLRHIFGNLLSNAIKYSPKGGQVSFVVDDDAGRTRFEVADQGIGIPAAEIPHLFESFHRASNVGNIPGTGLGLSIVKKSVDLHGGTIEVASELGQGTRFTVIL